MAKFFKLYDLQCVLCTEILTPMPTQVEDVLERGSAIFFHPESQCENSMKEFIVPISTIELWENVPHGES